MTGGFWGGDVFQRLGQMRQEMDKLFSQSLQTTYGVFPPINIYDDGEKFTVRAELPGVRPEDIDIQATGKTLRLTGKRSIMPDEAVAYHRRERMSGDFQRAFELPDLINAEKVSANLKDGVLLINLARAEQSKLRKISVKAS